jgi:hypothetical protein
VRAGLLDGAYFARTQGVVRGRILGWKGARHAWWYQRRLGGYRRHPLPLSFLPTFAFCLVRGLWCVAGALTWPRMCGARQVRGRLGGCKVRGACGG